MLAALGENMGSAATWSRPDGALYIWLRLPEDADAGYHPGVNSSPDGVSGRNYARFCYGYNTPEEIREGTSLLAEVFDKVGFITG